MPTILVTGASRGIGLEFVRQYAAAGWDVIAGARDPATARELDDGAAPRRAATSPSSRSTSRIRSSSSGWSASTPRRAIDVLLNNAGELGPRGAHREQLHRQFFGSLDYDAWRRVMEVNLFAPVRIAEAFAEQVERSDEKKMIFVSSTQGSIAEGTVPVFAYCSSKAALNKCVAMTAMALKARGIIATAVCPGHVRTELGGQGATLEPAESVANLRRLIARLAPARFRQLHPPRRYARRLVAARLPTAALTAVAQDLRPAPSSPNAIGYCRSARIAFLSILPTLVRARAATNSIRSGTA